MWICILDLLLEYWWPSILFAIARGVGMPLLIDRRTLNKEYGLYARVLVDIDFTNVLPDEILMTQCKNNKDVRREVKVEG